MAKGLAAAEFICGITIDMYFITMKCSFENVLLKIDYARSVACPPSWRWDSLGQNWSGLHLWVVAEGRGRFITPDSEHALSRGECFILRPPERYVGTHDPKRPLLVHTSTFRFIDPSTGDYWWPSREELPRHRTIGGFQLFESILLRYMKAWEGRVSDSDNVPRAWLAALIDEFRRPSDSLQKEDGLEHAVMALAAGIKANPAGGHSLRALSKKLGRSVNQTIRLFRRFVGKAPGALLQESRMEAARSLLLYSSLSVKEIAARLGYCDQFAFSKAFKASAGQSPAVFRSAPAKS